MTAGVPGAILLVLAGLALCAGIIRVFSTAGAKGRSGTFGRLGASLIVILVIASSSDYPVRTPILAAVLVLAAVWLSLGSKTGTSPARASGMAGEGGA